MLGFSAFADVARKETLKGYLQPRGGAVRVLAPRSGTVVRIYVAPGQQVEAGSPLLLIESSQELRDGGSLTKMRGQSLERQIAALRAQISAERDQSRLEEDQGRARLAGLIAEARSIEEQVTVQQARIRSSAERLAALEQVRARGYVSENEYRNREEHLLSLRQALSDLERRRSENHREQTAAGLQVRQAAAALHERTASNAAQLASLEGQYGEAGAESAQLLRAPVAGRVIALRAEQGAPALPGSPVLTISPGGAELGAVLFTSAQSVGLVEPGQRVRLIYDAYPLAQFGAHNGIVQKVSATALPVDGPARYKVEVSLQSQTIEAYGRAAPLQPDMTVSADIVLERRSFLSWLLEPIRAAGARN